MAWVPYLQGVLLEAQRPINADRILSGYRNLSGGFIKHYGFQWQLIVIVNGLD